MLWVSNGVQICIIYDRRQGTLADRAIDARAGVGYAFDQEFSTGFDIRDTDTVAELSDEAFFFFTVQGRF